MQLTLMVSRQEVPKHSTNRLLELIKPAVNGTVGMLKSILRDGYVYRTCHSAVRPTHFQRNRSTKVKRVVITSSGAAVLREDPNPVTFTEADWNNQCLEILKKYEDEGRRNEAPNMVKYRASKTLAERCRQYFFFGFRMNGC